MHSATMLKRVDQTYARAREVHTQSHYRYVNAAHGQYGKAFANSTLRTYNRLGFAADNHLHLTRSTAREFVFATGVSSHYFNHSKNAVSSIQQAFPNKTILFYDLGLTETEQNQIHGWCNTELRAFHFARYPPHVRFLKNYAFKFLIIADALESYPGVFWFDSISIFTPYPLARVYDQAIASHGFLMFQQVEHSVLATTHRAMYAYLPPTTLDGLQIQARAAGAMLVYRTSHVLRNILTPALMCSLEPKCIAPTRKLLCIPRLLSVLDRYIDCHRYDMSMINILALNAYGFTVERFYHDSSLIVFNRGKTRILTALPVKTCM